MRRNILRKERIGKEHIEVGRIELIFLIRKRHEVMEGLHDPAQRILVEKIVPQISDIDDKTVLAMLIALLNAVFTLVGDGSSCQPAEDKFREEKFRVEIAECLTAVARVTL